MAKPPKKKNLSDKVRKTKTTAEIKNNPFEVKINRKKFDVLGRKSKHDVGLPGVSRSKAINKRKETLLKEYKQKDRTNRFIDKRFGEYDTKMAPEDKILQRFSMERQRTHDRKDLFNLNEEEELTHYGQSLAEMEKFNDVADSDSESEEKGPLSAELTATHFGGGGGLLRKRGEDGGSQKAKSRQELIEELIQKSKMEKRERQVQKEESTVLTEKLDQDWKSIQALMGHKTPMAARPQEDKPKVEQYDMMVRELAFDMKAQPSERKKSPEEQAREDSERLLQLEADRRRRMLGEAPEDSAGSQRHLSADDLYDGFLLDKMDKKTLAYQDGKWNMEETSDQDREEEDDDEAEDDSDCEDDDDDGEEEESGEEGHSDLDSEPEEEEEEEEQVEEEEGARPASPRTQQEVLAQQEAAKAELPYTFTAPESYADLQALLHGHSPDNQHLIVARTLKCNHPSLGEGNKAKLQKLFGFLLEYVVELSSRSPAELTTVDKLIPQLYALCQMFPDVSCRTLQDSLSEAARHMSATLEARGGPPHLSTVLQLKVVSLLFPTSDFRHLLTTPALLCISLALSKWSVSTLQDVSSGLVLCCLALEYVSFSRRFLPELISFLSGLLQLAVPDRSALGPSVVPPFRRSGRQCGLLVLSSPESCSSWSRTRLPLGGTAPTDPADGLHRDHLRLSCLSICLDLVRRCCLLYGDLPSFTSIFQPIGTLLSKHLPMNTYPPLLQELSGDIMAALDSAPQKHACLVFDKKKPVPLKLFTPKIVAVLDYGKKRGGTKEARERERTKHKYQREFKGALREVKKDARFLAQEKLRETMSRDSERKRKVKELFGSLATQEGEWKALKRRKRK